MHRFYIPPQDWNDEKLLLTGAESHHCRNVLRLQSGDEIVVFDGHGHEVTAQITAVAKAGISLREMHKISSVLPPCRITLAQAIPKGKNMDLIVQKAVELGTAEIIPILTERTVVHLDDKNAATRQAKWQAIAIEAAKQCGQNWLPRVRPPNTLVNFFSQNRQFDLKLVGSLRSGAMHLKKILSELSDDGSQRPKNVLILIGPEGDFSAAELDLAQLNGCRPLTLGPIVLRVETAAIYCLSILSYELLN